MKLTHQHMWCSIWLVKQLNGDFCSMEKQPINPRLICSLEWEKHTSFHHTVNQWPWEFIQLCSPSESSCKLTLWVWQMSCGSFNSVFASDNWGHFLLHRGGSSPWSQHLAAWLTTRTVDSWFSLSSLLSFIFGSLHGSVPQCFKVSFTHICGVSHMLLNFLASWFWHTLWTSDGWRCFFLFLANDMVKVWGDSHGKCKNGSWSKLLLPSF